jgi:hypothetical protein
MRILEIGPGMPDGKSHWFPKAEGQLAIAAGGKTLSRSRTTRTT